MTRSPRGPLPDAFSDAAFSDAAFSVAQGRSAGLTPGRLRGPAFERPFHGVRWGRSAQSRSLADQCRALRTVLAPTAVFSHATAARLWRMPLPLSVGDALHVTIPQATAVRRPGVVGWTRDDRLDSSEIDGIPVTAAADTWTMLATMTGARGGRLSREQLVAIGDFLVSGERHRWGRTVPLATIEELAAAVARHGARRGATSLAWALPRVRRPVDSPQESILRLGLLAAGLPEPAVQPPVATAEGIRHPDLGYLAERVLLEYLGDVHRTDPRTWRQDLVRVQLFEDAGYRVILVGADDVRPDGMRGLAERVRRALG